MGQSIGSLLPLRFVCSIGSLFPLRLRLWLGGKLYRSLGFKAIRLSPYRMIKLSSSPAEVEAMRYIAKNTSIPVPQVHAVYPHKDEQLYIEMEYVHGETLEEAWLTEGRLSQEDKLAIGTQLKQYVAMLRRLPPPEENLVASALGNPIHDGRVGDRFFGPFSHRDFQSLTRSHLVMEDIAMVFGEEVEEMHNSSYKTCFTHADLVPRNIIVRDGRIVAIIDWEFSGWYPEYWEYTKGHYDFFPQKDWVELFCQAVPRYDLELMAEQTLWEKLSEPGREYNLEREGEVFHKPGSKPSEKWLAARAGRPIQDIWSVVLSSPRYAGRS